jgi:hypothetical protein
VKELRLRHIDTKDAANAYAPHFIADFNERFGKVPKSAYNAHRPLRDDEDLDLILTCRASRCVSATLTVQYDRVLYLLDGHFKFSDYMRHRIRAVPATNPPDAPHPRAVLSRPQPTPSPGFPSYTFPRNRV